MLRENLIDLEFVLELLPVKLPRLRDLDHNARMDLIDKGNASSPDPMDTGKLALNSGIHDYGSVIVIECDGDG